MDGRKNTMIKYQEVRDAYKAADDSKPSESYREADIKAEDYANGKVPNKKENLLEWCDAYSYCMKDYQSQAKEHDKMTRRAESLAKAYARQCKNDVSESLNQHAEKLDGLPMWYKRTKKKALELCDVPEGAEVYFGDDCVTIYVTISPYRSVSEHLFIGSEDWKTGKYYIDREKIERGFDYEDINAESVFGLSDAFDDAKGRIEALKREFKEKCNEVMDDYSNAGLYEMRDELYRMIGR